MRKLVFSPRAIRDLAGIVDYIVRQSGSLNLGSRFSASVEAKCAGWARFESPVGRPRPEYGDDIRSVVSGNYIVFLRYTPDRLDVLRVVEGHRDPAKLKMQ